MSPAAAPEKGPMVESEVVKTQDIAVRVSVERVIAGVAQIKLESMMPLGADYVFQNGVLDRLNRLMLRQVAVHEIDQLRDEMDVAVHQKQIAFDNMAENRLVFQAQLDDLIKRFDQAEKEYSARYRAFEGEWVAGGKQKAFSPDSHPKAKAELGQLIAAQVGLEDQIRVKKQEIAAGEAGHERNVPVYAKNIAKIQARIDIALARIESRDE